MDDAKAVGEMPTDVAELQKLLLEERAKNGKVEQMLEDALLELQGIKKERKSLSQKVEEREMALAALMEQMGFAGGEGDEGDMMGYGEDEGDEGDEEE